MCPRSPRLSGAHFRRGGRSAAVPLSNPVENHSSAGALTGESPGMVRLFERLKRVVPKEPRGGDWTIRYSSRIGRPSNQHSRISRTPFGAGWVNQTSPRSRRVDRSRARAPPRRDRSAVARAVAAARSACIIDGPPAGSRGRGPRFARSSAGSPPRRASGADSRRTSGATPTRSNSPAREVALNIIQRRLGHANLGTTSIYLQGIDPEEIIATVHTRRVRMMSASAGLRL